MQLKTLARACSTLSLAALCACPLPLAGGGGGGGVSGGSSKIPVHKTGTGSPIATIGDYTLTTGDLQERLDKQSPFVRARACSHSGMLQRLRWALCIDECCSRDMRSGICKAMYA